jgi:hypothetical protein
MLSFVILCSKKNGLTAGELKGFTKVNKGKDNIIVKLLLKSTKLS